MKLHKLVVDNADQTKEHEHAFLMYGVQFYNQIMSDAFSLIIKLK